MKGSDMHFYQNSTPFKMKFIVGTFALGHGKISICDFFFDLKYFLTFCHFWLVCVELYVHQKKGTKIKIFKKAFSPKFFRGIQNVK